MNNNNFRMHLELTDSIDCLIYLWIDKSSHKTGEHGIDCYTVYAMLST